MKMERPDNFRRPIIEPEKFRVLASDECDRLSSEIEKELYVLINPGMGARRTKDGQRSSIVFDDPGAAAKVPKWCRDNNECFLLMAKYEESAAYGDYYLIRDLGWVVRQLSPNIHFASKLHAVRITVVVKTINKLKRIANILRSREDEDRTWAAITNYYRPLGAV